MTPNLSTHEVLKPAEMVCYECEDPTPHEVVDSTLQCGRCGTVYSEPEVFNFLRAMQSLRSLTLE